MDHDDSVGVDFHQCTIVVLCRPWLNCQFGDEEPSIIKITRPSELSGSLCKFVGVLSWGRDRDD